MELITFIPFGSKNAISRDELRRVSGLTDRAMRQEIENLRQDGHAIINLQDGNGYFIPAADDVDKVRAAYKANERRAKSVLRYNKFLKEWEKNHGDTVRN